MAYNPLAPASQLAPIPPTHVHAHETGHLFGWSDEYFIGGGAVHRSYIRGTPPLVDVAMSEPPDGWKRSATTTLMGYGMFNPTADIPTYYSENIRKWFKEKTGLDWEFA